MYFLTFLEIRSPKIKVWAAFLLEASGESSFPYLSELPEVTCIPWDIFVNRTPHKFVRTSTYSLTLTLLNFLL